MTTNQVEIRSEGKLLCPKCHAINVFHTLDIEGSDMHKAGRPGNDGLAHKYHGRKKHGNRCGMGRYIKVCYRHYPTQKQKGRGILC